MANYLEPRHLTHGFTQPTATGKQRRTYHAWQLMKKRCLNDKCDKYRYYKGRGITVCNRWKSSFENFLADMGLAPTTKHSIERVNNKRGYSAENCIWATQLEQARNKSNSTGISLLSEATGINRSTLQSRLRRGHPLVAPLHQGKKWL